MAVPNIFGSATAAIPLSQLDTNFATAITLGNTAVYLGNTTTSLGNVTLTNVTISSGNVTVSTATVGAGSNTAPSITTTGDTNTGIFFPAADTIAFTEGGVESMRIDSASNVGIGTSSPNAKLAFGNDSDIAFNTGLGSTGTYGEIKAFNTLVPATPATNIRFIRDVAVLGNDGAICFDTVNTERMRIDSSGNLLIGYTSSNGSYKLQVNSQIFATNATIATSDGRYKENIQTLDGALSLVSQLNPVQFSWKEHPVHNFDSSGPTIGFIAQEVQQVLADKPYLNSIIKRNECVIEPEEKDIEGNVTKEAVTEEFLGIAEGNMIALLTKALQELKADFDAYKASHP